MIRTGCSANFVAVTYLGVASRSNHWTVRNEKGRLTPAPSRSQSNWSVDHFLWHLVQM